MCFVVCSRDSRCAQVKSFTTAGENKDVTKLVQALHQAAAERSVPPKQVLAAMTQIEKQKLPVSDDIALQQHSRHAELTF